MTAQLDPAKMKAALKMTIAKNAGLESEIGRLKNIIEEKNVKIDMLQSIVDSTTKEKETADKTISEQNSKLNHLNSEIQNYIEKENKYIQIGEQAKKIAAERNGLMEENSLFKQANNNVQDVVEQAAKLREENKSLQAKVNELQKENDEFKSKTLQNQASALIGGFMGLVKGESAEVTELRKRLNEREAFAAKLTNEINSLKEKLSKNQSNTNDPSEYEQVIEELSKENNFLKQKLENISTSNENEKLIMEKDRIIKLLTDDKKSLSDELIKIDSEKQANEKQYNSEIQMLKQRITDLSSINAQSSNNLESDFETFKLSSQNKINGLEQSNKDKSTKIDQLTLENQNYQIKFSELTENNKSLSLTIEKLKQENTNLASLNTESNYKISELEGLVTKLQQANINNQQDLQIVTDLQNNIKKLEMKNSDLINQNSNLKSQYNAEITELKQKLTESNQNIEKLENQAKSNENKLIEEFKQKIINNETEIKQQFALKIAELDTTISNQKDEISKLNELYKQKDEEINKLTKEKQNIENESKKKIKSLQDEINNYKDMMDKSSQSLQLQMSENMKQKEESEKNLTEKIQNLLSERSKLNTKIQELTQNSESLNSSKQEIQSKFESLSKENESNKNNLSIANEKLSKFEIMNKENIDEIQNLKNKLNDSEANSSKLDSDVKALSAKVQELSSNVQELETEKSNLEKLNSQQEKDLKSAKETVDDVLGKLKVQLETSSTAEANVAQYKQEIETLKRKIDDKEKLINQIKKENEDNQKITQESKKHTEIKYENIISDLKHSLETKTNECQTQKTDYERIINEKTVLALKYSEQIEKLESELKVNEERSSDLENQVQKLMSEVRQLRSEKESTPVITAQMANDRIELLRQENTELSQKLSESLDRESNLLNDATQHELRLSQLKVELSQKVGIINEMKTKNNDLLSENEKLSSQNKTLEEKSKNVDKLKADNDDMALTVKRLDLKRQELENQVEEFNSFCKSLKTEKTKVEDELKIKSSAYEEAVRRIVKLMKQLKKRQDEDARGPEYLKTVMKQFFSQSGKTQESLIPVLMQVAGCEQCDIQEALNNWKSSHKMFGFM